MDQRPSMTGKATALIAGTVVAVLLWGFGVEYMLHNYVFLSPPEISIQKMKSS
jgi:uncharacterized membrane protein